MGPKTKELIDELEDCAALLRSCSEDHWAKWSEKCASLLRSSQLSGIEYFEGAFGGMGSANDLVLHPINGHKIPESEVDSYNMKLHEHFRKAHELVAQIRKNMTYDDQ